MKTILDRYLDRVLVYANQPEPEAEATRRELKDHLLLKVEDLMKEKGITREQATLEALRQHGPPHVIGYQLRATFPWIDIRSHGTARGVVAIGPKAVGIFAFGGVAVGVVACGGATVGLFSMGGIALGLLFAWAGLGIGGIVNAGLAIGIVAAGGLSIGAVAVGGKAIGAWVPYVVAHGSASGYYTPKNVPAFLQSLAWLLHIPSGINRYAFVVILPCYILFIFGYNYLRYREGKRVAATNDWLIDGSIN